MKTVKKTRWTSVKEDYLPWGLATVGVLLFMYGLWFQTNGFVYVDIMYCIAAIVIGSIVGVSLMRYTANQNGITLRDIASLMFGYEVATILCLVILYVATTTLFFLLGVAAGSMGISTMWFYLSLILKDKKEKKEKEKAPEA